MTFNFHARYGLITYSQCGDLDPWRVVDKFAELSAECIIGRETHSDGGVHLHVFVDFGRKRRFRDARKFDVDGMHPNIESSRGTPWDGFDYCIKEGDIVAGGLERPSQGGPSVSGNDTIWAEAAHIEDREQFFEFLRQNMPKALITNFTQIVKYADWQYRIGEVEYTPPRCSFDYVGIEEAESWSLEFIKPDHGQHGGEGAASKYIPLLGVLSRTHGGSSGVPLLSLAFARLTFGYTGPKSLCMFGESRTGKTIWARSLGRHAYFCGLYSGAEAIRASGCQYAVFDDIAGGIRYFPGFKQWLGGMQQFQVKQLYRDPVLINWGKPCIWLANRDPREDITESTDLDWLNANCIFVHVAIPFVTFYFSCQ